MTNENKKYSSGDVSRRDFLRTSSLAVGGAVIGSLSAERGAHAASDDTIKVALIGCGGRGTGAASQALSTEGSVRLIAMADVFDGHLQSKLEVLQKEAKDKVDVPKDRQFIGFDAYKDAIALADLVILTTPPGIRPIHFEEAVRQGKNIFMEKPVAVDGPGIRRVIAAAQEAKKKNLKIGVGLQRRHETPYLETIKRLHNGAIGDITSMRCYWNGSTPWVHTRESLAKQFGRPLTEMEYQLKNWYYFVWLCGDHIVEQHIHNLDVINWVKNGYPVKARGMGGCEVRKGNDYGEIFDHHSVEFEYADGSILHSMCRHQPGCWNSVSEHVVGTKGRCHVGGDRGGHRIEGENAWSFPRGTPTKNPYQQEHDNLFAAIRDDKPFNEAERGAMSTLTAILGRMATYSGKEITFDQALNSQVDHLPKIFAWDAPAPVQPNPDGSYNLPIPGNAEWLKKIV